jgi:multiple sugar transport system ATP-binding protein
MIIMGIRPEDITVVKEGVAGEVNGVEPLGRDDLIDVRIDTLHIHALVDPKLSLKMGDPVKLHFDTNKIQFFDPGTEKSLLWF